MARVGPRLNQSNTLLMISSIYSSLTKTEKKVADYVKGFPEETVLATVTDLSEKAGVGETSVIRFCRKLGFRGFHEFKLSVAQDLVDRPPSVVDTSIDEQDDLMTVARKLTMQHEILLKNTLDLVNADNLRMAVDKLLAANKVYVYGVGSSGITALDLHYQLMRLGLNVEAHRDSHIIAMSASLVKKGDLVFAISTSGSTRDLVDPVKEAKKNGADVICLTGHLRSPIATYADTVLLVSSREMPTEGGALATKFMQTYMLNILTTLLTMKKEDASESLKKTASSVADKLY
ncbi:MurR/RpiR family transcriptional regulator [Paenibacillus sp. FSL H8-0457]|uniref:MurR/RpiR family transcriptional regulator n=1 Tax=Paenibacillus TaxID=44249 RepID=UPI0003E28742|nr:MULTISPECIES: MurR/RpiR family transcriptional regulator [Paenibacillus]ETT64734.1 RpiR family transcriptional regulator [Paenibacillus sp. FSL H8-457]PCL92224.1 MurR/RpiR family transcriptional regulator [Paenibacillus lautus]QOT08149.1 MurR/RpiR family transcriptional regulator [Paenibacillus sp. JNUCC-32]GIP06699.1 putative HTH-type transcriptional regulator [Paenibacillus lautus]